MASLRDGAALRLRARRGEGRARRLRGAAQVRQLGGAPPGPRRRRGRRRRTGRARRPDARRPRGPDRPSVRVRRVNLRAADEGEGVQERGVDVREHALGVARGSGTAAGGVSPASFARRSHCEEATRRRVRTFCFRGETNITSTRARMERARGDLRRGRARRRRRGRTCSSRDFIAALEPGVDGAMARRSREPLLRTRVGECARVTVRTQRKSQNRAHHRPDARFTATVFISACFALHCTQSIARRRGTPATTRCRRPNLRPSLRAPQRACRSPQLPFARVGAPAPGGRRPALPPVLLVRSFVRRRAASARLAVSLVSSRRASSFAPPPPLLLLLLLVRALALVGPPPGPPRRRRQRSCRRPPRPAAFEQTPLLAPEALLEAPQPPLEPRAGRRAGPRL